MQFILTKGNKIIPRLLKLFNSFVLYPIAYFVVAIFLGTLLENKYGAGRSLEEKKGLLRRRREMFHGAVNRATHREPKRFQYHMRALHHPPFDSGSIRRTTFHLANYI